MKITKRRFLSYTLAAPAVALAAKLAKANSRYQKSNTVAQTASPRSSSNSSSPSSYTLPTLPYAVSALEPHIDRETMQLHHGKHHQTYVNNLNQAVAKYPELQRRSAEDLIRNLTSVPEDIRTMVRNNAGGHVNHSMFWQIMGPRSGGEPTGEIASAIKKSFGSFGTFKEQFNDAGAKRFGSGWVWLVRESSGALKILSTPNQDNPLMEGQYPVMGNDVWEHAYYLKYQNRRADYLTAWWNTVNWAEVNRRLAQAGT